MILIDPPVNPFSPIADIEAWIAELRAKPASHERDDSITQAEKWLAQARMWAG